MDPLISARQRVIVVGVDSTRGRHMIKPCSKDSRPGTPASMVVVGSRGHGGFTGLIPGSVSSSVAERAHCPVPVSHGASQVLEGNTVTLPIGVSA